MEKMSDLMTKIFEDYKKQTAKECYEIVKIENEVPGLMDNKFGGTPYIPKGETVPIDSHGNPMALFLQVNMKDIELDGYPRDGILEIFNSTALDIEQESAVCWFAEGLEPELDLPMAIYDEEVGEPLVGAPIKITVQKAVSYMPINDYRANAMINEILSKHGLKVKSILDVDDALFDAIARTSIRPYATIGGYADFVQWDIRNRDSNKDECLLKVDCGFDEKIGISDGVLSVLCSHDDVKNKTFENAIMYWDCS